MKTLVRPIAVLMALFAFGAACSSTPPVKTEAYAELKNHHTYEYDFTVVWKAIEEVFRNTKIVERDPENATPLEIRKLSKRSLKTDWSYGKSRDKYEEYQVNGTPRKVWLQERSRFELVAKRVMGGVDVVIKTDEEIEKLKADGSSAGFSSVGKVDSSRANEILTKINAAILAAPPSSEAP